MLFCKANRGLFYTLASLSSVTKNASSKFFHPIIQKNCHCAKISQSHNLHFISSLMLPSQEKDKTAKSELNKMSEDLNVIKDLQTIILEQKNFKVARGEKIHRCGPSLITYELKGEEETPLLLVENDFTDYIWTIKIYNIGEKTKDEEPLAIMQLERLKSMMSVHSPPKNLISSVKKLSGFQPTFIIRDENKRIAALMIVSPDVVYFNTGILLTADGSDRVGKVERNKGTAFRDQINLKMYFTRDLTTGIKLAIVGTCIGVMGRRSVIR